MFKNLALRKVVLGLGLAAVMFAAATGSASANDRINPYTSYQCNNMSEVLDQINRDHPVQTPNHRR